jgi:periodic tryptophan protein 1
MGTSYSSAYCIPVECRGTDNLILAGHVEGDAAMLEVYVYNDVEDALYVHHDILLPSLPLALGRILMEQGHGSLLI